MTEAKDTVQEGTDSIKRWLEAEVECRRRSRMHVGGGYAYNSIAEFVLAHGRGYTPARRPAHFRRGPARMCYQNSYQLARRHGLIYVEGYALHMIPALHAWCVEPGSDLVIEATWDSPPEQTAYFGIPFAWEFIRRHWHHRNRRERDWCYCQLDQWQQGWPLLKGLPEETWKCDEAKALARFRQKQKGKNHA